MGFGDNNDSVINQRTYSDFDQDGNGKVDLQAGGADIDLSGLLGMMYIEGGECNVYSGASARSKLQLAIGSDIQAYDSNLTTLAGLDSSDGNFIVGSAAGWVVEFGSTARNSLGVGEGDTPTFTSQILTNASGTCFNQVNSAVDSAGYFRFRDTGPTNVNFYLGFNGSPGTLPAGSVDYSFSLCNFENTPIHFATSNAIRMTVEAGGNINIQNSLTDGSNSLTIANAKTAYDHSQIAGGDSVHVSVAENSNWDSAFTHVSNNGTDHSYIDQDVTQTGTPTFAGGDLTNITDDYIPYISSSGWANSRVKANGSTATPELQLSGTSQASISLFDSGATANSKEGRFIVDGDHWEVQTINDARTVATTRLDVDLSNGDVDVPGNFTAGTIEADNGADFNGLVTNITVVGGIVTAIS